MTTPTPRTDRDFPEGALHLRTTDEFMARIRQQERDLAAAQKENAKLRKHAEAMWYAVRVRDAFVPTTAFDDYRADFPKEGQ